MHHRMEEGKARAAVEAPHQGPRPDQHPWHAREREAINIDEHVEETYKAQANRERGVPRA